MMGLGYSKPSQLFQKILLPGCGSIISMSWMGLCPILLSGPEPSPLMKSPVSTLIHIRCSTRTQLSCGRRRAAVVLLQVPTVVVIMRDFRQMIRLLKTCLRRVKLPKLELMMGIGSPKQQRLNTQYSNSVMILARISTLMRRGTVKVI